MNTVLKFVWAKIKRNPIIVAVAVTIAAQAFAKAMDTGHFTFQTWSMYAFQLAMGFVAREFTVPLKEHEEVRASVSEAIVNLEAQKQKEINQAIERFSGGEK